MGWKTAETVKVENKDYVKNLKLAYACTEGYDLPELTHEVEMNLISLLSVSNVSVPSPMKVLHTKDGVETTWDKETIYNNSRLMLFLFENGFYEKVSET